MPIRPCVEVVFPFLDRCHFDSVMSLKKTENTNVFVAINLILQQFGFIIIIIIIINLLLLLLIYYYYY